MTKNVRKKVVRRPVTLQNTPASDPAFPMLDLPPTAQVAPTKSLLQQADALINGQRQADYGDKAENFTQIAMGIEMVLARKLLPTESITAHDVALIMMQVKIARSSKSPGHVDSILDIAGYAGCADKVRLEVTSAVAAGSVKRNVLDRNVFSRNI